MKRKNIGFVLLALMLAGIALVTVVSAITLSFYIPNPVKTGSNTMYIEGNLYSSPAAGWLGIGCSLVDAADGSYTPSISNHVDGGSQVSVSGYESCTSGHSYYTYCTGTAFTPSAWSDGRSAGNTAC